MDPKFFWLVMSVEKNDARIIDSESDAWGYLSQCDKFKRTTGAKLDCLLTMTGICTK